MRRRRTSRSVAEVDANPDGGARFVLGEYRLEDAIKRPPKPVPTQVPSWLEPETVLWFRT